MSGRVEDIVYMSHPKLNEQGFKAREGDSGVAPSPFFWPASFKEAFPDPFWFLVVGMLENRLANEQQTGP